MMKKNRLLLIAFSLLVLGVILVLRLWPRTLDPEQCGELYRKYVDAPGIRASYVKDFPIDDTLTVDALLLQATDSLGWETLKNDFHAFPLPEDNQKKINQGVDIISIHLAPKTDPTLPMDTTDLLNNNVVAISRLHQTISIFNVTTRAEMDAVRANQFEIGL